jgi:hypothetical protein
MQFSVTCHGSDPLGLREMLERFANEQLLPAHVTHEEATARGGAKSLVICGMHDLTVCEWDNALGVPKGNGSANCVS